MQQIGCWQSLAKPKFIVAHEADFGRRTLAEETNNSLAHLRPHRSQVGCNVREQFERFQLRSNDGQMVRDFHEHCRQ